MSLANTMKQICEELNVTISELARLSNQSFPNLSKKFSNETLSYNEFIKLCELLNVKYEYNIILPDGKKYEEPITDTRVKEKIELLTSENELKDQKISILLSYNKDIRTAMNTISGSAGVALNHIDEPEKVKECLDNIIKESKGVDKLLFDGYENRLERVSYSEIKINKDAFTNKKVLLVEDNKMNCDITKELLQDYGFVVDIAENGLMAVNKCNENINKFYDIILMDIEMPLMDGIEATKYIRKLDRGEDVPIIALSANTSSSDMGYAIKAGVNAYITKPLEVYQLLANIQRLIEKRR